MFYREMSTGTRLTLLSVDVLQGDEYGNPTNTVVVDTRHMSSAWFSSGSTKRVSRSNVGQYQRGIKNQVLLTLKKENSLLTSSVMVVYKKFFSLTELLKNVVVSKH